ncbi:MAG TPA: DUF732 domain-containing protein [Mycobacterium sp.]|nr:DUF732 domain-containing protein [Mycobacterium sp.]
MRHSWTLTGRLAVSACLIAAAAGTAPARADERDDSFLSALGDAGINLGNPSDTVALGQSVCPMFDVDQSNPAPVSARASMANAISSISGLSGMPSRTAGIFMSIALLMYCPPVIYSLSDGDLPDVPGMPSLPVSQV